MSHRGRLLGVAALLSGACTAASHPAPALPHPPDRVPPSFTVERASLDATIDPAAPTFSGHVRLEGAMVHADRLLWIRVGGLEITRAIARPARPGAAPIELEDVGRAAGMPHALRAPAPLVAGASYTLELDYRGTFAGAGGEGAVHEDLDGHPYVFTSFAAGPWRAVPALDDHAKVPWTVTLTVPRGMVAVANAPEASETPTPDGHTRIAFAPTAPIDASELAYAVGPFEVVPAGSGTGGAPLRVLMPAGHADDAAAVAEAMPAVLAAFERWTGIPYPFAKLDLIGLPSYDGDLEAPGIISNWYALLRRRGATDERPWAAQVVAIPLVDTWFGELVGTRSRADATAQQAFATWLRQEIVRAVYPVAHRAESDAAVRNAALASDARDPASMFVWAGSLSPPLDAVDGGLHDRGEAIVRMIDGWVGPDAMQAALRAYLAEHAHGVARTSDLLDAIAAHASAPAVREIVQSFLAHRGAPVVHASIDCAGARPAIVIAQQPDRMKQAPWTVPVCVVAGDRAHRERACGVSDGAPLRLELASCPTWVWPDAEGVGYYRTELSDDDWAALGDAGWSQLGPGDRLAAVEDLADTDGHALAILPWVSRLVADGSP
ncbi:MAG TPA: M1 family aminopeptidase, partial [Kofleriaceae bacterium]|nr:M1 family aminopeptidase [Kofleriaceae bacterium]